MILPILMLIFSFMSQSTIDCSIPSWWELPSYEECIRDYPTYDEVIEMVKAKNPNYDTSVVKDISQQKNGYDLFGSVKEFISKNKYKLLAAWSTCFIHQIYVQILKDKSKFVTKPNTWSNFKKNIPIERLYEIPESKLLNELMDIIYETFSHSEEHFDDEIEPLYLFIKASQKEMQQLESFVNIYSWLRMPLISLLFPNLDNEWILAQEKIERLTYFQDLISEKIVQLSS